MLLHSQIYFSSMNFKQGPKKESWFSLLAEVVAMSAIFVHYASMRILNCMGAADLLQVGGASFWIRNCILRSSLTLSPSADGYWSLLQQVVCSVKA